MSLAFDEYGRPFIVIRVSRRLLEPARQLNTAAGRAARLLAPPDPALMSCSECARRDVTVS